jgi:hypothetical protein
MSDAARRRWYWYLTVVGWLLAIEAASSLLLGIAGRALAGSLSFRSLAAQAGVTLGAGAPDAFDAIARHILVASEVQIVANAVLLVGCIGLLLRRKWGWYAVTILHVAEAVVGFLLGLPLVRSALAVVAPEEAMDYGLLITVIICLVPLSVVAFLMLRPIANQFESPPASGPIH